MLNTITKIDKTSPARGLLSPGEKLVSVNGHPIEDVLDYKYHTYDAKLLLETETPEGLRRRVRVKKPEGADLGLEFEAYLMDRAKGCGNRCLFCFVDQLPRGLRKSLYFKDDDARLSFLTGNYITLTNLTEREIDRICDLRISPLNISVHATDPALRERMLQNPKAGEILPLLRRFAAAGVAMDCQIVCCPGLNDGEVLSRSMADLAALWPRVNSVSVVPVGLTKHRERLYPLAPFDEKTAGETIDRVEGFAAECLEKLGSAVFWCSDEFYLRARRALPGADYYEDYSQLENGVGLLRLFEEEFQLALEAEQPDKTGRPPFSIATGVSAAPFLEKLLALAREKFPGLRGEVYAVENDFFGRTIDVAGLVTGGDLIARLRGEDLGARLFIPAVMLRHGEGVFLDDMTAAQASEALGVPVAPIESDGASLLRAMLQP